MLSSRQTFGKCYICSGFFPWLLNVLVSSVEKNCKIQAPYEDPGLSQKALALLCVCLNRDTFSAVSNNFHPGNTSYFIKCTQCLYSRRTWSLVFDSYQVFLLYQHTLKREGEEGVCAMVGIAVMDVASN